MIWCGSRNGPARARMYAGYIIEEAFVKELYSNPIHPYTHGLLNSLPRLDVSKERRLTEYPWLAPLLLERPVACPFNLAALMV